MGISILIVIGLVLGVGLMIGFLADKGDKEE